ncbi:MAG TPA: DUF2069 domain-containing protein, partial [Steroidobacteraceae bacterium]|nr:DUF2069 domain-containing protein [Steroidobacteraceae bacterium]
MNPLLARRWRLATLASVAMLMIIVIAWQLTPTANVEHLVLAFVFCIPLVAPLAGLWRGKRYTYRWATLCVIPYFVIGLTEVIADPR